MMRTVNIHPWQGTLLVDIYDKWACLATIEISDTLQLASLIENWIFHGKIRYTDMSTGELFTHEMPDTTE